MSDERKYFDVDSAAQYLREIGCVGVSAKTVYSLIASGGLKAVKMGRRFYLSKPSIDEWLDRHSRRGG